MKENEIGIYVAANHQYDGDFHQYGNEGALCPPNLYWLLFYVCYIQITKLLVYTKTYILFDS